MPYHLKLIDVNGKEFGGGLSAELLGDGKVISQATVNEQGAVEFNVDVSPYSRLSLRLAYSQPLPSGADVAST